MGTPSQQELELNEFRQVAVIVAHPDDETLWAGGLLLSHPEWSPVIITLCRRNDADRAPKFLKALAKLNATGAMGDLDDGPEQTPLSSAGVRSATLALLPDRNYDLVLTHGPHGEYTRHRRHEEVSQAVRALWQAGQIRAARLWQFAYEDGAGSCTPRPRNDVGYRLALSDNLWTRKRHIITQVYGFRDDSWEARAVSRIEAFDCFLYRRLIPRPPE